MKKNNPFLTRKMIWLYIISGIIFIAYIIFSFCGGVNYLQEQRNESANILKTFVTIIIVLLTVSFVGVNLCGLLTSKSDRKVKEACCFSFVSAPVYLIFINACLTIFETEQTSIYYATSVLIYIAIAGAITQFAVNVFMKIGSSDDK